MTQPRGFSDGTEPFEPSSDLETTLSTRENEPLNVCRAAALALFVSNRSSLLMDSREELSALGFANIEEMADHEHSDSSITESFQFVDELSDFGTIRSWQSFNEVPSLRTANEILLRQLTSESERESVAATAALWQELRALPTDYLDGYLIDPFTFDRWLYWRWRYYGPWHESSITRPFDLFDDNDDPALPSATDIENWREAVSDLARTNMPTGERLATLWLLLRWRLTTAMIGADPIAAQLASAAVPPTGRGSPPTQTKRASPPPTGSPLLVSTMIHGTWAWKGDWWRPQGDFHQYVHNELRSNLYSRGARYSWSGAYRDKHRQVAACDFHDWASDVSPDGIHTLFAHSYGAEIGARAINAGTRVAELVMLSAPVTPHVCTALQNPDLRIIDIRIPFDPVLAIARVPQRVPQGVSPPNLVPITTRWRLNHGATHDPRVWTTEEIPAQAGFA